MGIVNVIHHPILQPKGNGVKSCKTWALQTKCQLSKVGIVTEEVCGTVAYMIIDRVYIGRCWGARSPRHGSILTWKLTGANILSDYIICVTVRSMRIPQNHIGLIKDQISLLLDIHCDGSVCVINMYNCLLVCHPSVTPV